MNEFLFLENTLPSNNHFLMQLGEGTVFNDLGPEGAITNNEGVVRACLAPYVKVSATQHAGPVKIETLENGLVAIRIDGYLTPHFFKVEDLSKFFRKDDESKSVWADFDPITKEISFFNKNPLVSAEVYIYQVDQVTSLKEIENEGFVPNDDFNLSYTALIGPRYDVSCAGGLSYIGLLQMPEADGNVIAFKDGRQIQASNLEETLSIMRAQLGITAEVLTEYIRPGA